VKENIRRLKEVGIPLTLAITPSAYMTDGEEIVRLAHEMGVPFNINSGLMSPREETGRFKADADLDVYIRMMKLRRQLQGHDVEIAEDADDLPDVADGSGEKKFGVTCGAGRSGFSVSWCGEMRPCHTFPGEAHPVLDIGFAEAWKRTNALANHFPLPLECQGCSYQRVCKFCVAEHASGAPVGHANPAICAYGKRLVCEKMVKI
jgi:radical SAM protein with 4Fe4S-binding SPASM domain